ncbi:MAG TPA: hypothetical protein VK184_23140 [Nostocaceae cyanobacterium]|nr:hypothetical protein [Nostocaceae cyanobacterium]
MNNLTETRLLSEQQQQILNYYSVEDINDVIQYLNNHPHLINFLLDAPTEIRNYFPTEKLKLWLLVDPDSTAWEKLVLSICTQPEYVDAAANKLDLFDENWWLKASVGISVNLCINLDFE